MSDDKIDEIKKRHEKGRSKNSHHYIDQVIESLDYLHGLDQLHDKDNGWETQLLNIVWWAADLVEGGAYPPSVAPEIWDAFIAGDFDSTLGVATDGARHHLKEADDDRAFLLDEVKRLTRERDEARAEVERLRAQIVCLEATGAEASDEIDRLREALEAKP